MNNYEKAMELVKRATERRRPILYLMGNVARYEGVYSEYVDILMSPEYTRFNFDPSILEDEE